MDIDALDQESRTLYLSAQEIKRNIYWNHVIQMLDREVFAAHELCRQHVIEGKLQLARYQAAKVDAYNWLLQMMEKPIKDAEVLAEDQPQEV